VARFNKRPLRLLDQIYDFIGGQRDLSDFALESAIQPVHDLGRQAERAGFGLRDGYWMAQATQAHVAAGVVEDAVDIYAPIQANNGWPNPIQDVDDLRVWAISASAIVTDGETPEFLQTQITLSMPAGMVGPSDINTPAVIDLLLWWGDTIAIVGVNSPVISSTGPTDQGVMPVRIEPGAFVSFGSEQTGAGSLTVSQTMLLWVGCAGCSPPGLS